MLLFTQWLSGVPGANQVLWHSQDSCKQNPIVIDLGAWEVPHYLFFCKQFKLGSVSSNESRICSAGHRNYPGAAGYLPLLPRQVLTALCHGTLLWGRQDRAWNSSWHELYTWHRVCSQKGKTLFVTWSYTNNNKLTKSMNYVYARRYICICPITL